MYTCSVSIYFFYYNVLVIRIVISCSVARTVGVFWMNAAETWVDISSSSARKVDFTTGLT